MFLDKEILVTPDFVRGVSFLIFFAILFIGFMIVGLLRVVTNIQDRNLQDYKTRTTTAETNIKEFQNQGGVVDIDSIVNEIMAANKQAISFYDSLASDIPTNLWLTYYYNKDGNKVAVEGISTTINDIYGYYKSLKVISPQSSIKLNRLQVVTGPLDEMDLDINDTKKIFDFEIFCQRGLACDDLDYASGILRHGSWVAIDNFLVGQIIPNLLAGHNQSFLMWPGCLPANQERFLKT